MSASGIVWTFGAGIWLLVVSGVFAMALTNQRPAYPKETSLTVAVAGLCPLASYILWVILDRPDWPTCIGIATLLGAIVPLSVLECMRYIQR